jgi:hypothetical protein
MARRRLHRKSAKVRRHAAPLAALFEDLAHEAQPQSEAPALIRETQRVERLAYTRAQAAAALGMTSATFARRVLPLIETVQLPWGKQLVPVDEIERLLAEHRRPAPARPPAVRAAGRRPMLPDGVVRRIAAAHDAGHSLGQIARDLNSDGVPTAHGGARWWPSTVRVVLRGRAAARLTAGAAS